MQKVTTFLVCMRQTFEHFLNTATVMKSPKPLSISIFDYLKRFDSGLRQCLKSRRNVEFTAFLLLFV